MPVRQRKHTQRVAHLLILLAAATACGGDKKTTEPDPPAVRYTLTVSGIASTGSGSIRSTGADTLVACIVQNGAASGRCSVPYDAGTSVVLAYTPVAGHSFSGWGGDCTGTGTCQLTLTQNRSVGGGFSAPSLVLSVTPTGGVAGTVRSQAGLTPAIDCTYSGTATSGTCSASYVGGTSVTLTARERDAAVARFVGWTGASCTGRGTCSVAMSDTRALNAQFGAISFYALEVAAEGTGAGTVLSQGGGGINCSIAASATSGTCAASVADSVSVTLVAAPTGTSSFDGWTEGCTGTAAQCVVAMGQARRVRARFSVPSHPITVAGAGGGSGTILSNGVTPAISCTWNGTTNIGSCTQSYPAGVNVTITAIPSGGSTFTGWSGACTGTGACTVSASAPQTVTASFAPAAQFVLTVAGTGSGAGTVVSSGVAPAINCTLNNGVATGTCVAAYNPGTSVTLSATPQPGGTFNGWSGTVCSGTGACVVTMSQSRSVTAGFTAAQYGLSVAAGGVGGGTVSAASVSCSIAWGQATGLCAGSYIGGTLVTLTATPNAYSTFTGWSGACSNATGPCVVTMNQAESVVASFDAPMYTLTLTVGAPPNVGGGSVYETTAPFRGLSEQVSFGQTKTSSMQVPAGTLLRADASGGASWFPVAISGACTAGNASASAGASCTFTMNGAMTVTVSF